MHLAPFKIGIRQIGNSPTAALIENPFAVTGNVFTVINENIDFCKYLLAVLNSKLIKYYWQIMFSDFKTSFPQVTIFSISQIPIPEVNVAQKKAIADKIDQILDFKKGHEQVDISLLEREIDLIVYKLYNLTYEEVKVIDDSVSEEEYENVALLATR